MAFHPDVSRGQAFQPSALLSNDVRHMVNAMNGFRNAGILGAPGGVVRIQVYNNTGTEIPAGTAVNFSESGSICGDAVPCEMLKDTSKPWGVTVLKLAAKEMGDCVISGPVQVSLTGSGDYAQPSTGSPATFTRGATGAPVIFAVGGKGMINLGAATQDNYDGPFALSYDAESKQLNIAAGHLSRNGDFVNVDAVNILPQTGEVCVCSTLGNGEWSVPEVKFATPSQDKYPIGKCTVTGESVALCNYRVPVAIIVITAECPLSAEADEGNQ